MSLLNVMFTILELGREVFLIIAPCARYRKGKSITKVYYCPFGVDTDTKMHAEVIGVAHRFFLGNVLEEL